MNNLILLIGAGLAAYTLFGSSSKSKPATPQLPQPSYSPDSNFSFDTKENKDIVPITQARNFPLRFGSRGNEVKLLQEAIMKSGNNTAAFHVRTTGGADGIFGSGTQKAVNELGYGTEVTVQEYAELLVKVGITTTKLSDLL
ncbi:peptidoglycan-binding protein [Flammeovirga sp. SJP92]|uniref:peptidoglycan-binding domain-containing protein n=1 Tax=Flammeovirga sp. SJP92 TaxID=1775430 RepID=UPI00078989CB|nr:hypothetical protein [Flammeovirga sp. SJP92]KXX67435.1 hypothetical protein AVL50_26860 [Flammeovirga sp. SJP92]